MNYVVTTGYPYGKSNQILNSEHYKNQFQMDKDLNVKRKALNILEENIGYFYGLG